ncbi:hypothetical protein JCM18902_210 [Psychrobacter sp. JCM 18902]|nr:hypothetical protein JCM18902_210 [Psychrobacter sp. JCM 18902]
MLEFSTEPCDFQWYLLSLSIILVFTPADMANISTFFWRFSFSLITKTGYEPTF